MDVRISSTGSGHHRGDLVVDSAEKKKQFKKINDEHKKKKEQLIDQLTKKLSDILLGEKIPLDVVNEQTGEIIIPANRKITKTLLRKLALVHDHIEIEPSPIRNKILKSSLRLKAALRNWMTNGNTGWIRWNPGTNPNPAD